MNKQRRKEISEIIAKLNELGEQIEAAKDAEQETFDNMPESFQNGEKGEAVSSAIDALEGAHDLLEQCVSDLETAIEV